MLLIEVRATNGDGDHVEPGEVYLVPDTTATFTCTRICKLRKNETCRRSNSHNNNNDANGVAFAATDDDDEHCEDDDATI